MRLRLPTAVVVVIVLLATACGSDDPIFEADLDDADADEADEEAEPSDRLGCQWPMYGHNIGRTFSYPCETAISPDTVVDLRQIWFFRTNDVVSASPVVVDDRLYVGDWSGVFYAIDAMSGEELWRLQLDTNPQQYGGQISASATFAEIGGGDALVVGSGRTVHALSAVDGTELWQHELGDGPSTTEVLSSPLVIGNLVIVTFDTHGAPLPSGVIALDLETGEEAWYFDPELGGRHGCGGIWGSPTVDADRGLIFAGTANCPATRDGWTAYTEALFALDATTGEPVWTFQPHEPNDRDIDFAGAPNLFTDADGRDLVGLGNKDAHYYAVDRETGELVWSTKATEDGYIGPNFSSGGFVGPSAVSPTGVVIGGTAVGDCPCMHAMDVTTGEIVWQQLAVEPTYAPTTEVGGVAFVASIDTVLRALDVATGDVLWSDSLGVLASGGIAVVGDDVWAVAGFRQPGSPGPSDKSGVFRYTTNPDVVSSTTTTTTTTIVAPAEPVAIRLVDAGGPCIDQPCELSFGFKDPPPGTAPRLTLSIQVDPFELTVTGIDLGNPAGWLREGSEAAAVGAVAFGVMISERDDDPNGGFVCVLGDDLSCTGNAVPHPGASYNRISILALFDTEIVPDTVDGFSRLVDSISFNPPLQTEIIE